MKRAKTNHDMHITYSHALYTLPIVPPKIISHGSTNATSAYNISFIFIEGVYEFQIKILGFCAIS